jgi:hypothetical protein
VAALNAHEARFVIIGGIAGVLHGSPVPTNDFDICASSDSANLERLAQALKDLDARIFTATVPEGLAWARDAKALAQAGIWNLITRYGRFDISFVPSGTEGYEDLRRGAVEIDLDGEPALVASVIDIIRSKEAAGRPKDRRGLIALRKLLEQIEEPGS